MGENRRYWKGDPRDVPWQPTRRTDEYVKVNFQGPDDYQITRAEVQGDNWQEASLENLISWGLPNK